MHWANVPVPEAGAADINDVGPVSNSQTHLEHILCKYVASWDNINSPNIYVR